MKKIYFLILSAFTVAATSAQTTVSFTADKDNTIYSGTTSNSNGSGIWFFVGRNGANNGNSLQRGLLHFNISTIPAGSVITSASLTMVCDKAGGNVNGIAVHKLTQDWGEGASDAAGSEGPGTAAQAGDATWSTSFYPSTAWTTPGGTFSATQTAVTGNVTANTTVVIASNANLVADIQSWVNNSATNFGWVVRASDEAPSNTAKRFISRNNGNAAQRPTLSVTYTAGSFPVALKSFNAVLKNNSAVLEWKTATEINNKYFDVEHSSDGVTFSSVGKVNGNGNSTKGIAYTFTHNNIQGGKNYYRLAQYDFDGAVKYSQVVLVSLNKAGQLQVKPNPATSFITVAASTALNGAAYFITSSSGHVVKKGILNSQQIDVQQLPAGQYWLNVEAGKEDSFKCGFIKR